MRLRHKEQKMYYQQKSLYMYTHNKLIYEIIYTYDNNNRSICKIK